MFDEQSLQRYNNLLAMHYINTSLILPVRQKGSLYSDEKFVFLQSQLRTFIISLHHTNFSYFKSLLNFIMNFNLTPK
jgi:hypothetical protein